jgi:hypothetical protein
MIRSVYLAARYSRRVELAGYAEELRARGHEVVSRWLDGSHEADETERDYASVGYAENAARFASEDAIDVENADLLVSFTEPPESSSGRGGRHVEFGLALALRQIEYDDRSEEPRLLVVVGPRENVFHTLADEVFEDWPSFLDWLAS